MFSVVCSLYSFTFVFAAILSCPGGKPLINGKCPEFTCTGRSSCNFNGNCNGQNNGCDCDEGFSGSDCSFNLAGKKSYVDMKLYHIKSLLKLLIINTQN